MKKRCECQDASPPARFWERYIYDKKKELPFVEHKPNECKCSNDLRQFWRNGKKVWLCSNCQRGEEELKKQLEGK